MVLARIKIARISGGTEYINGIAAPSLVDDAQVSSIVPETQIQLFAGDVITLQLAATDAGTLGLSVAGQTQNKYASVNLSVLG